MFDDAGRQIETFGETPTSGHTMVTHDTFLEDAHTSFNYGGSPGVLCDGSGPIEIGLIAFDLSSIGPRQLVSAELVIYVPAGDAAANVDLYAMNECWVEGTVIGNPGVASWAERDTGVAWLAAGAGVGSRDTVSLATFQPVTSMMSLTISFNASGVAAIQTWLSNPTTNCGLAIVTSGGSGAWRFNSSDYSTADQRPMLRLALAP
jgi:hypothetical protein